MIPVGVVVPLCIASFLIGALVVLLIWIRSNVRIFTRYR